MFCLIIFGVFRLYSGMWKYAGLNDMNRILGANLVCAAFQVIGSCLFVCRMPITYYFIGAVVQFALIAVSRFSYRMLSFEISKISKAKNSASLNAMVVGSGEAARMALNQLDRGNVVHPVCVLNYKEHPMGSMLDGVQVVKGLDNLEGALKKHKVAIVIIADSVMPQATRKQIRQICKVSNVEVQDFSVYLQNGGGSMTLKNLAEYSKGEVELVIDGKRKTFADAEQALMDTAGNYVVESFSAKEDKLVVELRSNRVVLNDLNASWVKDQEKETGEEISFF